MRFNLIDVSDALLSAQRTGKLVIFAGAGVSMGAPANYPCFARLAEEIGSGKRPRDDNEPIDRYLGQFKQEHVQVHKVARGILSRPSAGPTGLHTDLLKLFRKTEDVRLVTTNFDNLFTVASGDIFADSPEVFYAPALPLGYDFSGIVHLHGSVERSPEHMILTDDDFGRAYLTDGWATRFLMELFRTYTVLFVGYSHDDPIMHYLARGLPPEVSNGRFALTPDTQIRGWTPRGIHPITYPLQQVGEQHRALNESVQFWVDYIRRGFLDSELLIKRIVHGPPPPPAEHESYLLSVLQDIALVHLFLRHAVTPDWLRWADSQGAFDRLFGQHGDLTDVDRRVSEWFAEAFVRQYPSDSLALIQRHGQDLSMTLWSHIAGCLAHRQSGDAPTFRQWLSVVLGSPHAADASSAQSLVSLLLACRVPDDSVAALMLLDFLLEPQVKLVPNFSRLLRPGSAGPEYDVEVGFRISSSALGRAWSATLSGLLPDRAVDLELLVVRHLRRTFTLLEGAGKASSRWDPVSHSRGAIERHSQNRVQHDVDMLIDVARDVIESMVLHAPARAKGSIDDWSKSGVPLLVRLAIHAVTESSWLSADDKIEWSLRSTWLFAPTAKHELFRLLQSAYPGASRHARLRLLRRARRAYRGGRGESLCARTRGYESYNLAYWLHMSDPYCPLAEQQFRSYQTKFRRFSPRPHPEFSSWSGSVWHSTSNVSDDDALTKSPEAILARLVAIQEAPPGQWERDVPSESVMQAASRSFDWGWRLAKAMARLGQFRSGVWSGLFLGWSARSNSPREWYRILSLLRLMPVVSGAEDALVNLLLGGVERPEGRIPSRCLDAADELAFRLRPPCAMLATEHWSQARNPLDVAVDTAIGRLVLYWLHSLSRRRQDAGINWAGLPTYFEWIFGSILEGRAPSDDLGAVVLAHRLDYLLEVDARWTQSNLIEAFVWHKDSARAARSWLAYLNYGNLSDAVMSAVAPLYLEALRRLSSDLSSVQEQCGLQLANLAVFSTRNPIQDGWLSPFMQYANINARVNWVSSMWLNFSSLPSNGFDRLWAAWLGQYWQRRTEGIPVPLDNREIEQMLLWSTSSGITFPKVVAAILELPNRTLNGMRLFYEVSHTTIPEQFPHDVLRLVSHV